MFEQKIKILQFLEQQKQYQEQCNSNDIKPHLLKTQMTLSVNEQQQHHHAPIKAQLQFKRGTLQLWQFLVYLLEEKKSTNIIQWVNKSMSTFKLCDPEEVARQWGAQKNRPTMNYDKLSRSLRYYYEKRIMEKVSGERYVYKFLCNTNLNFNDANISICELPPLSTLNVKKESERERKPLKQSNYAVKSEKQFSVTPKLKLQQSAVSSNNQQHHHNNVKHYSPYTYHHNNIASSFCQSPPLPSALPHQPQQLIKYEHDDYYNNYFYNNTNNDAYSSTQVSPLTQRQLASNYPTYANTSTPQSSSTYQNSFHIHHYHLYQQTAALQASQAAAAAAAAAANYLLPQSTYSYNNQTPPPTVTTINGNNINTDFGSAYGIQPSQPQQQPPCLKTSLLNNSTGSYYSSPSINTASSSSSSSSSSYYQPEVSSHHIGSSYSAFNESQGLNDLWY